MIAKGRTRRLEIWNFIGDLKEKGILKANYLVDQYKGEKDLSKSFIEQVHYIRIPVKNVEQSAQWYRDILGLQLLNVTEELAALKINEGPFLLILIPTEDETFAHFTVNQEEEFSIGFTSSKLAGFHQHLTDHEVKVDEIKEDEGHAFFHFYDPDGNKLQAHW